MVNSLPELSEERRLRGPEEVREKGGTEERGEIGNEPGRWGAEGPLDQVS